MSGSWPHNIRPINPGDPVQADIVNRPDRSLQERTDYLKDRLDASDLGRAIFEHDATVAPEVLPGMPVFWNWATNRYEPALVAVTLDETTQVFTVQPSSDCVGMCYEKKTADRADIVLRGLVVFKNLDSSIGQTVEPGKYYLSAVTPGGLSKQKPPVTVVVCHVQGPRDNCSDELRVVVMPQSRDYVEEHTHYRFDLVPRPAGTNTLVAGADGKLHHTITDPNAELQGWLPADHAVFNGKAPVGAVFGYNIQKHTGLATVWPPIPIQSVSMLWDKGENTTGATEIPLGARGLAICDINGIWWMSDCQADVPWPAEYTEGYSDGDGLGVECPRNEVMRVVVIYLRMLLGNDRSVVTSLVADEDEVNGEIITAPIAITNCDDLPATTGDLKLNVDLQFDDVEGLGGEVVKGVANRHQLVRGWAAEGVVTTTPNYLTVTGTRASSKAVTFVAASPTITTATAHGFKPGTRVVFTPDSGSTLPAAITAAVEYFVLKDELSATTFNISATENGAAITPTDAGTGTIKVSSKRFLSTAEKAALNITEAAVVPVHQGVLRIDYTDNLVSREILPQIIRLSDTVERLYLDVPYLGFPAGQNSLMRVRLNIPEENVDANLNMQIRVRLFGRGGTPTSAAQLPTLQMSYRRLPRPDAAGTPLPATDTAIDFSDSGRSLFIDTVVECNSESFPVAAGDTVLVTVERVDDNADAYDNDVGILRLAGIISSAE